MNPIVKYQRLVDKLPIAAKSIILAAILGGIFVFWYYSFWQGVQTSISSFSGKISALEEEVSTLEKQLDTIESNIELSTDELSPTSQLISAKQSIKMLHDLLTTSNNLVLLQLRDLPTKEVALPSSDIKIFEHGVEITFLGDYFSTLQYLQSIEKLKWKIFWDKLEYEVIAYPNARITLHLHTVNDDDD